MPLRTPEPAAPRAARSPELVTTTAIRPHRFSVRDYHRLGEIGVLAPEARVELLDGVICDMSPIGSPHGGAVNRLTRVFVDLRGDPPRWVVQVQNPVRLSSRSEPVPDLALLRPRPDTDDFYDAETARPVDVLLVVEVADTTLRRDRGIKAQLYAKAGIVEYWILNLNDRQVEVHREPNSTAGVFRSVRVAAGEEHLSPAAVPEVSIPVRRLLRNPA